MLELNKIYSVVIEENNVFSNGVCHIDGVVVFVKDALAGETCEIKITKINKSFAYAEKVSSISISKNRLVPSCKSFGTCGGCAFLNTTLDNENRIKESYLLSTFKKHGIDIEIEKIACPVAEKYRNKVVLFVKDGSYGYMQEGTNKIIPHTSCELNDPIFDKIAKLTVEELKGTSLRAIYIRKSSHKEPQIMVSLIFYKPIDITKYSIKLISEFPNVQTVLYSVFSDRDFALEKVKFKTFYGSGYINDELCGLNFRISPSSFYQVNHKCAEQLYNKAKELIDLKTNEACADLFCGTGTIGILCAKNTGATVYGVEIVESSIKDAKYNAKLNGVNNASFEANDAKNFNKPVDACIIDPPRKGCSPFMLETLLRLKPKKIVYVSCNADTLARDLKSLLGEYQITSPLYPFNMFPRTSHVESVVRLTRK